MTRTSYFTKYANAALTYSIPSGVVVTDPDTGNITEQFVNQTATAILEGTSATQEARLGLDVSEAFVKGYLVSPMTFPSNIKLPQSMSCVLDGRNGTLNLKSLVVSPWGEQKYLGQAIEGVFKVTGGA